MQLLAHPASAAVPRSDPLDTLEREWIEGVRQGRPGALEPIFKRHYTDLVFFAESFVKRRDVAEEVVQEVFFSIWRRRTDWRPRGPLKTYLLAAVRKNSLAYLRRRRTEQRHTPEPSVAPLTPGDALQEKQLKEALRHAVRALPERRRQVFLLSRENGLTYAEIAAVLGLSVKTVETHMTLALKGLRRRLRPFLDAR